MKHQTLAGTHFSKLFHLIRLLSMKRKTILFNVVSLFLLSIPYIFSLSVFLLFEQPRHTYDPKSIIHPVVYDVIRFLPFIAFLGIVLSLIWLISKRFISKNSVLNKNQLLFLLILVSLCYFLHLYDPWSTLNWFYD